MKRILFLFIVGCSFLSLCKSSPNIIFWNWFKKNEQYIYDNIDNKELQSELYEKVSNELGKVDSNLVFNSSPILKNGKREFTISADGLKESFVSVEKLVKQSPKFKNWNIIAFRQRIDNDNLGVRYNDYEISYDDLYYKSSMNEDLYGIDLYIKNFDGSGQMQNTIYILLDALLGEYDTTMRIDWIEWHELSYENKSHLKKIVDLRKEIDNRK